jgi:hypothetical protein
MAAWLIDSADKIFHIRQLSELAFVQAECAEAILRKSCVQLETGAIIALTHAETVCHTGVDVSSVETAARLRAS